MYLALRPLCVVLSFFPMENEDREGAAQGTFLLLFLFTTHFGDRNLVTKNRHQKNLSPLKGLGSMDEPCSKLEDVIRSKIHSVERLPRKLGYKTYRK